MPTLAVHSGADQGTDFPFDQTIVIGRAATADLPLTDSSVSRRHAIVEREAGAWTVRDLDSANGTFVNDRRVALRAPLANGDLLRLGSVVLAFADETMAPVPGDTTVIKCLEPDAASSHVLLRVGAAGQSEGTGAWSIVAERFARISAMMFDERALLAFALDELLKLLPQAERGFVMLWDVELQRFVPAAAGTRAGPIDQIVASQTLLRDVFTRREAVLVANAESDRKYSGSESMVALRMRTAICAPLLFQDEMFGTIQVDSTSSAAPFGAPDLAATLALASQIAMALAYAHVHARLVEREMVQHDLALARKVQRHFLPPAPPRLAGFDFAVAYTPALAVGGDLYDFITLGDGRLAIVVGDVSGKGIAAALFAAKVISDMRHEAAAGQADASAILTRLNRTLAARDHEGMFVTAALVLVDPRKRRLTVASAGHPLPLVRDGSGHVVTIGHAGDGPLGLDPDAQYRQWEYEIDPGDAVVLYTDGVIEALDPGGAQYGQERLAALLQSCPAGVEPAVNAITRDVAAFEEGRAQSDDVTVVCFERQP